MKRTLIIVAVILLLCTACAKQPSNGLGKLVKNIPINTSYGVENDLVTYIEMSNGYCIDMPVYKGKMTRTNSPVNDFPQKPSLSAKMVNAKNHVGFLEIKDIKKGFATYECSFYGTINGQKTYITISNEYVSKRKANEKAFTECIQNIEFDKSFENITLSDLRLEKING